MNIEFQRRLDRILGSLLCRVFSLFPGRHRAVSDKVRPRKILVILLSEMGSLVLARPMFDHLARKYPGAAVFVLLFEQNRALLETLGVIPPGRIIGVSNASLAAFLKDSLRALLKLRRIRVDTVLDCELFSRISSLYAFLSGAGIRVGFHPYTQEGLYRGDFINRPVLYNPYHHISQQYITLAEAIESDRLPTVKRRPASEGLAVPPLAFDRREMEAFGRRFESDLARAAGRRLVLIYPGGGLLAIRAWPLSHFSRLAQAFIAEGCVVGVVGLEEDRALARTIVSRCGEDRCLDLTGYTRSVRELLMLFHRAALLITNDGGPAHFAALTPVPAIVLYGPETPALYGPLGDRSYAFYSGLSCSPCLTAYNHRKSPCDGDNLCLKGIRPEVVLEKAREILAGPGLLPSVHSRDPHPGEANSAGRAARHEP